MQLWEQIVQFCAGLQSVRIYDWSRTVVTKNVKKGKIVVGNPGYELKKIKK